MNALAFYQYRHKMNLKKSISDAMDLTSRLQAALKLDDMELCQDILQIRAGAMATFESWHRTSSKEEIASCHSMIKELAEADQILQKKFKSALDESAGELRQLVSSGCTSPTSAYNTNISQACVDRRA